MVEAFDYKNFSGIKKVFVLSYSSEREDRKRFEVYDKICSLH